MGVKVKFEKRSEGGFAISFEEDGSGDLNKVIGSLCEKHKGDSSHQSPCEIFTEIAEAVGDQKKIPLIINRKNGKNYKR